MSISSANQRQSLRVSSPQALRVLEILIQRRKVQRSFSNWARLNQFEPAPHHRLLMSKLIGVSRGTIPRLAVFMPPGSAKSTYGSVLFPAWYLAQHRDHSILAASHTLELAQKWGRRVRNLCDEYGPTLELQIAYDNAAAGRWALTSGGEYYAAGVGVGIAGFRADLAIIDDPVRSREDADSDLVREKTWDWYKSDLSPRMKPGGRIVLIQTRWNEDDLAGRLLLDMRNGGDVWDVLSLPAIARGQDALGRVEGEILWDDAYGYGDFIRHEQATQSPRNWSALYQQSPAPEEGTQFKADWLRPYTTHPAIDTLAVYGGSDYAVTADGGDYTCHVVVGLDVDKRCYLLDLWRGQSTPDVWVREWCRLVREWRPLDWAEETGQITSALGPYIEEQARERKAYVNRERFATRHEKAIRCQSIRGRMANDGLYVPTHAHWYADFRAELLSFPAGRHDDQVDALGLVGQLIDRMVAGRLPPKLEAKKIKSGYRSAELEQESWKVY
jgi:predicted phage terminase large subunit-like protein